MGDEVKSRAALQKTEDGRVYEDGELTLSDGRTLAWRWWGEPEGTPIYLLADRPGYGGSTRKPGRGIADIADDYVELLDFLGLDRVPATGTSGGGPHVLALAARHPDRHH